MWSMSTTSPEAHRLEERHLARDGQPIRVAVADARRR